MLSNFNRKKIKFSNKLNIDFQVIDWSSYDDYDEEEEEQESDEEFEHPSSDDEKQIKIRKFNIKVIMFAIRIGDEDILYP